MSIPAYAYTYMCLYTHITLVSFNHVFQEYTKKMSLIKCENNKTKGGVSGYGDEAVRKAQQVALWAAEAVYVVWLFFASLCSGMFCVLFIY